MNFLLVCKQVRINALAVVVVREGEEIIRTLPVHLRHDAIMLHIFAEHINQFIICMADLAKAHCIIEEGPVLIMLRDIIVMQVDDRLAHIGKVELDAGKVCDHQSGLTKQCFIAHCTGRRNDLYEVIFCKVICLRAYDRVEHILDPITVLTGSS